MTSLIALGSRHLIASESAPRLFVDADAVHQPFPLQAQRVGVRLPRGQQRAMQRREVAGAQRSAIEQVREGHLLKHGRLADRVVGQAAFEVGVNKIGLAAPERLSHRLQVARHQRRRDGLVQAVQPRDQVGQRRDAARPCLQRLRRRLVGPASDRRRQRPDYNQCPRCSGLPH